MFGVGAGVYNSFLGVLSCIISLFKSMDYFLYSSCVIHQLSSVSLISRIYIAQAIEG